MGRLRCMFFAVRLSLCNRTGQILTPRPIYKCGPRALAELDVNGMVSVICDVQY